MQINQIDFHFYNNILRYFFTTEKKNVLVRNILTHFMLKCSIWKAI